MVSPEGIGGVHPESTGKIPNAREAFENRTGVYENAPFGRVVTAMVTPFREDGSLNLDIAQELAHWLQLNGSEGLVLAGTTGEAPTLTHKEQMDLFWAVNDVVDIPILAGTGSNNTEEAVALTREVTEEGFATGLLVVSPYYNKPGQSGIEDYFAQVLEATDLPVVMYDIPGRTGRPIAVDTIRRLASRFDNLAGVKDAAGDPKKSKEFLEIAASYDDFVVYSGDDSRNLELYRAGAVGAISVASHWAGKEMAAMFDAVDVGDMERAEELDDVLKESYEFETNNDTPNPIPTKAMMREVLGKDVGFGRSPMRGTDRENTRLELRANEVYEHLRYNFAELTGGPLPRL